MDKKLQNKQSTVARNIRNRRRAAQWRQAQNSVGNPTKKFVTKFAMTGGRVGCPPDPPSLTTSPWNTVVVQKAIRVGTTNVTGLIDCTDLCYWLIDQLGIPFKASSTWYISSLKPYFNLRVIQVRAWNLTGRTIGIQPYDYTTTGNIDELGGWIDSGTQTNLPSVGYQWPLTSRQHVITVQLNKDPPSTGDNLTEGNKKVCVLLGNSGDTIIAHFHLEWRFPPVNTGTIAELQTVYDLTSKIASDTRQVHGLTVQTKQKLDEIYQALPSKTITGAAHVFVDGFIPLRDSTARSEDSYVDLRDEDSSREVSTTIRHERVKAEEYVVSSDDQSIRISELLVRLAVLLPRLEQLSVSEDGKTTTNNEL